MPARYSMEMLKTRVVHDLEELLNCRREAMEELPEDFEETRSSLLNYGLPDLGSLTLDNPKDRALIQRLLEQTLSSFEPRLTRIRVFLESQDEGNRTLKFRIDALLRVEPAGEPITFDTIVDLTSQKCDVRSAR